MKISVYFRQLSQSYGPFTLSKDLDLPVLPRSGDYLIYEDGWGCVLIGSGVNVYVAEDSVSIEGYVPQFTEEEIASLLGLGWKDSRPTVNAFRAFAAPGVVFTADQKRTIHQLATSQGDPTTMSQLGKTLGQALFDAGHRLTISKGHLFFETGQTIEGDFDPTQHQPVRRWGQAANPQVSKGQMEGSELLGEVSEIAEWLADRHPDWGVDPRTLNAESWDDLRYVRIGKTKTTFFGGDLFPWRAARNKPFDGTSSGGQVISHFERMVLDHERRLGVLERLGVIEKGK